MIQEENEDFVSIIETQNDEYKNVIDEAIARQLTSIDYYLNHLESLKS